MFNEGNYKKYSGNEYSDREIDTIVKFYGILPYCEIAKIIGRSTVSVRSKLYSMGFKKFSFFKLNEIEFIRINSTTMSVRDMSAILGRSEGSIKSAARRYNISLKKYGEKHHCAKLSDHDVDLIRDIHDAGIGIVEISRKFDVCRNTISNLCNYSYR